jgi:hypothetical protein
MARPSACCSGASSISLRGQQVRICRCCRWSQTRGRKPLRKSKGYKFKRNTIYILKIQSLEIYVQSIHFFIFILPLADHGVIESPYTYTPYIHSQNI